MEVKNNIARFDSVDSDLGGWDATQCACGHGDTGGQRLRRCELLRPPPLSTGKAPCRRIASRFSRCSALTEDLPSV
jgi:hypothetical protein